MKVLNKFLKNGTGNYVEGVVNGRTGSGPVRSTSCETPHDTFKIASWNIGTMRGRSSEIVETITRRNIDLCCVQEVRWRGASARHIIGKDSRYKFFWVGNNQGTSGVGVLLAEKWVDKVYDIKRVSDRIMLIKLLVGEVVLTVLSVYAPQTGLEESTKDAFYNSLQTVISELPDKEIVIPCGDWNGHVGREAAGYEGVHGGSWYGECNADGDRVLEFAVANDFVIGNTFFVKRDSHLITYQSGNAKTQIDFILLRKRNLKMAKDIKVIPSEECVPQHKLLICELRLKTPKPHPKPFSPKLRHWRLKEPTVQEEYERVFKSKVNAFNNVEASTEEIWNQLKTALLDTTNETCGKTVVGPPIHIDVEMVVKAITMMKTGKAAGPSGIVAEMLKASGDTGARLVADLANDMVRNGVIPSDWEDSFIINIYKGKGDALERGDYRGLKLLDHVMKGMERVIEKIIRERISIDDMQFGFMPGRGTTDAIFILRQLQEKHLVKNKKLYFAFVDLEKAFDRVPRKVIWWAMRKLGIEEWIVRFVQAMYNNTRSRVRVNNTYSDEFGVKVGVHQGSVLSPLLFVIVLEALSCEFRTGTPWELLYADDLVISAETEEGLKMKLNKWKTEMEAKGLRVNMGKTKIMVSGVNLQTLKDSGEYPCSVCRKGVGSNSIYCAGCSHWVHKKCSGVTGSLKSNPDYRCSRCKGTARPIDGRPHNEWLLMQDKKLDVVDSFCYLGDTIGAGGGCDLSVITRIRSAWGKFRELLPILTSRALSYITRGQIYSTYIRTVLLYASECWAPNVNDLLKLQRNDRAMIRWTCNVRLKDHISSDSLLRKLGSNNIQTLLRYNRLRWFGHVVRNDGCINSITEFEVVGQRGRGRPKKTWKDTINNDLRHWKLSRADPANRMEWRKKLRTNIGAVRPTLSGTDTLNE